MRIMKFMGAEMSKFKAFDGETHTAAHALEQAAHEQDGQKTITAFARLQTTCLNCHQAFRGKFVEHFYGTDNKQTGH
jgi:cytochrome c556